MNTQSPGNEDVKVPLTEVLETEKEEVKDEVEENELYENVKEEAVEDAKNESETK